MAKKKADEQQPTGSNCTDETKRDSYRKALVLKIAVEGAQEMLNSKRGAYRNYLKEAGKKGVDTKAITDMLAIRFEDPDLILIEERERLKMMELSGFLPGIMDKLIARYSVEEPTNNEEEDNQVLIAYDRGHQAGLAGIKRDDNPYPPGSLGNVKWVDGWLAGQRAIADEMAPGPQLSTPRPPPKRPTHTAHHDEPLPGNIPDAVH